MTILKAKLPQKKDPTVPWEAVFLETIYLEAITFYSK